MDQTNFQIINASAGSGKTYDLVLEYLKILLKNDYIQNNRYETYHEGIVQSGSVIKCITLTSNFFYIIF